LNFVYTLNYVVSVAFFHLHFNTCKLRLWLGEQKHTAGLHLIPSDLRSVSSEKQVWTGSAKKIKERAKNEAGSKKEKEKYSLSPC